MTAGTEVWLYGSAARGDRDALSDVDVLIAGHDAVALEELDLPARERVSISRYAWAELTQMAGYGSLFLHHIKLEGKPLLETPAQPMRRILAQLGEYDRTEQELDSFRRVLDDVEASLRDDYSIAFELSVVATAARHAAILGCYLMGRPNFGRDSAFEWLLPRLGHSPEHVGEFVWLYRFRRADDVGSVLTEAEFPPDVRIWVDRVRELIDQVERLGR